MKIRLNRRPCRGSAIPVLCALLFSALPADTQAQQRQRRVLGQPVDAPADTAQSAVQPRALGIPAGTTKGGVIPAAALGSAIAPAFERRVPNAGFLTRQLDFPRVKVAQVDAKFTLKSMFRAAELPYPPFEMFLRIFKQEQVVEVWVRPDAESRFSLLKEYPICAIPGRLGPKRRAGDFQVPEGFYHVEAFNPQSEFYLSMRVNYPNAADRMRGETAALGGDIFIHGGCSTVGCVPVQDDAMKEIYWLAVETTAAGQARIPVHIFPTRMDATQLQWLKSVYRPDRDLTEFWQGLQEGYAYFESNRLVPQIVISQSGGYVVSDPGSLLAATPDEWFAARVPPATAPRIIGPRAPM